MTRKELLSIMKFIVHKCDLLINDKYYEADAYTQDTVEDISEVCNRVLDGDYGKIEDDDEEI